MKVPYCNSLINTSSSSHVSNSITNWLYCSSRSNSNNRSNSGRPACRCRRAR